jgi:GR25 family glycosyltransferase involved in LPS biosynthesis/glycosyltransferase involved in cell wall biosynthesis
MIVKDEAHIIESTLAHLMEQFPITHWVIDDTGSTDGTQKIISKFFEKRNIPGTLHKTEWRDFGFNRSKALEHAYNLTDYVLVWDADDSVVGRFVLPRPLTADQYSFTFGDAAGFRYSRTQLFNNRKRWCYKGVLHEYPASAEPPGAPTPPATGAPTPPATGAPIPVTGDYYFVSGRTGARSRDPEKYKKDAAVLEKALIKEPNNDRYVYYCANSYKDAGEPTKAIKKYKQLLTMNGWSEERYMACIQIYDLSSCETNLHYLVDSYSHSPERIEGIYRLVRHYCIKGQFRVALMYYGLIADHYENHYSPATIANKLFVSRDDYDYYLPYYVIICAIRVSNWSLAERMYTMIFRFGTGARLDSWWNINLFNNLHFVVVHLKSSLPFLNSMFTFRDAMPYRLNVLQEKAIASILDRHRSHLAEPIFRKITNKVETNPKIFLSITTCKRYDLFSKTMNSLLRTWVDLDAVDYFFCVDDNSAEADRSFMRSSYPFFDFYMKGPEEKGHRTSMNIIWAKLAALRPTYWIHLEDDWLFFKSGSYVRDAVAFLERAEPAGIHQVLYNRNYAELYDWDLNGGAPIPGESRFIVHLQSDSIPGRSSGYWPHYSFRPSVIRVAPLLTLGNYDSPNTFFERDYADRWTAAGYRSAFFDDIRCLHIGKLTSDKKGQNAYALNNESQFDSSSGSSPNPELVITELVKTQIFIVNLKRREDRKTAMGSLMAEHGIKSYRFYEAVDGLELQWSPELLSLFAGNDFGSRRGVLGCALSHYRLWQQLVSSAAEETQYVILEDDITVRPDFKGRLEAAIRYATEKPVGEKPVDILFLGHHCWNEADRVRVSPSEGAAIAFQPEKYVGGTFGYLITKRGAAAYLDYIKENGIRHGIDMLVKKLPAGTRIEVMAPHIVLSEWDRSAIGQPVDTDIQNDPRFLSLKQGWTFHPRVDSIGNDICHKEEKGAHSVELLMKACLDISGSVAFNTLGFVKSSVALPLVASPYFGSGDGIYIRDGYVSVKRVKLLCNWCSSAELCAMVAPMLEDTLSTIHVTSTTDASLIDYWLILNKPQEGDYYDPARTVVFQLEPWCGESWQAHGAKTWGDWARPDPARFLRVLTAKTGLIPATWQISRVPPPADYVRASRISCILSEKYTDPGQRHRVDFLRFLEAKGGIPLSVFGRENYHGLTSYAGPVPGPKEAAIQPYKYYFMCENNAEPNYVTEKLWDAILCETLCFYWGAPNVADHVNPQAFIQLDMSDYEESYRRIQNALATDAWASRLPHIRAAKRRLIEEQQMFAVLGRILSS